MTTEYSAPKGFNSHKTTTEELKQKGATLTINGLKVDARAIGEGVYDIICDKGEEAIVSVGMIPLWVHEMLNRMIAEKVVALAAAQGRMTVEELTPHVDAEKLKETVQPIIQNVCVEIYAAAGRRGMMMV